MLSEKAAVALEALKYRSDADWEVNILPFGSIYWSDEMPAIAEIAVLPDDTSTIFAMFGMRLTLWDGEALSARDQELWDAVQRRVPNWALFRRLSLSNEQRFAREKAEQQVEREFQFCRETPTRRRKAMFWAYLVCLAISSLSFLSMNVRRYSCSDCMIPVGRPFAYKITSGFATPAHWLWRGAIADLSLVFGVAAILCLVWQARSGRSA